jgi:glycosyltransferase involved in cell wall biosynthesis
MCIMESKKTVELSIIIPFFNERENVERSIAEITEVVRENHFSAEIIAVDDGSTDGTGDALRNVTRTNPYLCAVTLAANFGQSAALSAGFHLASGTIIVTLDGDLQNDPHDIPVLLKEMEKGYDVVSGWRYARKDFILTRCIPSFFANKIISLVTGIYLHDFGCTLKAYRVSCLQQVHLYGELHRFLPALCKQMGAKITEVKVNHRVRTHGCSKYSLMKMFRVMLDIITVKYFLSFSARPMHMFGCFGLIFLGVGFLMGLHFVFLHFFLGHDVSSKVPSILVCVLLLVFGFQFIVVGLLAEIIIKSGFENSQKKPYVISKIY